MPVSHDDVAYAYREMLGREPAPGEVDLWLGWPDLASLKAAFEHSPEGHASACSRRTGPPPDKTAQPSDRVPSVVHGDKQGGFVHLGMDYHTFFNHLDKILQPRFYFEIGTATGNSLKAFSCDAVCVDPNFVLQGDVLGQRRRTFFHRATSDQFFAEGDLARHYPAGFDVAFLDGMHLSEFLLRDFINAEQHSNRTSILFLHDCLPLNIEMAQREHNQNFWAGDVWRMLFALKEYRPDLNIVAINCPPTGLVACRGLDRSSSVLADHFDEILKKFEDMDINKLGLSILWSLFPIADSRKLVANPGNMMDVLGPGWNRA